MFERGPYFAQFWKAGATGNRDKKEIIKNKYEARTDCVCRKCNFYRTTLSVNVVLTDSRCPFVTHIAYKQLKKTFLSAW